MDSLVNEPFLDTEFENLEFPSCEMINKPIGYSFDLDIKDLPEISLKAASPSVIIASSKCFTIEEEIFEVSIAVDKLHPKLIRSPYRFSDVKLLSDEIHVVAVTFEGVCVYLDLYTHEFSESYLSSNALSIVLLYSADRLAIVKERDFGILHCIRVPDLEKLNSFMTDAEKSGIGKICLSPDETFLYARLWKGEIIRWNLASIAHYETLLYDKTVICMNISPDGVIVLGTSTGKIMLFTLSGEKKIEKTFKFPVDAYICFSAKGETLILCLLNSIKLLEKDSLEILREVPTTSQSVHCEISPNERYLIAGLASGDLFFIDLDLDDEVTIKVHSSEITSICTSKDQTQIYTFSKDFTLGITRFPQLSTYKTSEEICFPFNSVLLSSKSFEQNDSLSLREKKSSEAKEETFKPLCMAQSDKKDIIIVGGESNNITVWDRISMKKNCELMGHTGYIYSLANLNDEIVASGSADCKVILWNYRKMRKFSTLLGHTHTVSAVVKIDSSRLASGSYDKTIRIWIWDVQVLLYCIQDLPSKIIALCTPKYNKLIVGMKHRIHCWDLQSNCEMFEKECKKEITCFRIFEQAENKSFIGLSMEEDSWWIENPFFCTNVEFWGKSQSVAYEFIRYLRQIMALKVPEFEKEMDRFTIFPYKLNVLHFYAFFNIPEYLKRSLANNTPMLVSSSRASPLSIAIQLRHKECIQVIIETIWPKRVNNPFLLTMTTITELKQLNLMDTHMISKVYKLLLIKYSYCPIVNTKKNILASVECSPAFTSFVKTWTEDKMEKPRKIEYLGTGISFYMRPGTRKSVEFLNTLQKCRQTKVFQTELIQKFLQWKWEKLKWWYFIEVSVFFIYFSLFCMFLEGVYQDITLSCFYLLSSIFSGFNLWFYFKEVGFWKYFFTAKLFFLNAILGFYIVNYHNFAVYLAFFIICVVQGLKYAKLIEKVTDCFLMIKKVFSSLLGFVLVLLYFLLFFVVLLEECFVCSEFAKVFLIDYYIDGDFESLSKERLVIFLMLVSVWLIMLRNSKNCSSFPIVRSKVILDYILKAELLLMIREIPIKSREFMQITREKANQFLQKPKSFLKKSNSSFASLIVQQSRKNYIFTDHKNHLLDDLSVLHSSLSNLRPQKSRPKRKSQKKPH